MARIFSYLDLVRDLPAPSPDVIRLANQISVFTAFQTGHAVIIGSAAWGDASWRSDIDVVVYDCSATEHLREDIDGLRNRYEASSQHIAPRVDIILIAAEHEELVERDNLVSRSVPILEPKTVSEVFSKVRVRIGDHIRALGLVKGNPWKSFATAYAEPSETDREVIVDLLGEYSAAIASGWRENEWSLDATTLTDSHLAHLGYVDGFATHFARLILSHQGAYPVPDRRADVREALATIGRWGVEVEAVLAPFFALTNKYEELAERVRRRQSIAQADFNQSIRTTAATIDFDPVEQLVWSYRAEFSARRSD